jgi:hypothetical protein
MEGLAGNLAFYRFLITVGLILGGGLSIVFGVWLFSRGAGLYKALDRLAIETDQFKASVASMSAGGVLILGSVIWAWGAVWSVPRLAMTAPDGSQINIGAIPPGLIGTTVYTADKKPVGNIRALVLRDPKQPPEAIIETASGAKAIDSMYIRLDKTSSGATSATVRMSKGEIDRLPTVSDSVFKMDRPRGGVPAPDNPSSESSGPKIQMLPMPAQPPERLQPSKP